MIVHSDRTVVTCAVFDWADVDPARKAWLADCLARHLTADWGDLDADDRALNDHALSARRGRVMSSYGVRPDLAGTISETNVWVITDDLDDPDTATTVLWPSDY
jgi:hypothetical protein